MKIPLQKLTPTATLPTHGSESAAGYDLYASESWTIYGFGGRELISTGISVAIPRGHYGRIAPRSGLAAKHGIDVLGGVIDADYRGEIKVILINHDAKLYPVRMGDKIAQLIIERCFEAEFIEFDELPGSERGQGGFGSTGR